MKKRLLLGTLLLSMSIFGKDYTQYKSNALIGAKEAKEILETNKNSVLIDVRPTHKFMRGNVAGSYHMWRPDMEPQDNRFGKVTGMRASREELESQLNKMGINNDTTIILTGDNLDEFRLWWLLDLYGAENVKVIDGGYSALKGTGIKTTMGGAADEKKGTFKFPEAPDKDKLATLDDMKQGIKSEEIVILDTRSAKENTGKSLKKGAFLKGKIPKSVWLEWSEVLNNDKTIKPYDELVELFEEHGIDHDTHVLAYCQSGVRSAHTTFVLRELMGHNDVKNYDGSWIEWSYEGQHGNTEIVEGE